MNLSLTKILKHYFSPKHRVTTIAFLLITVLFFAIRLDKFDQFFTFHIDQALHIAEAKQMVDSQKITLIGPIVSTRLVEGRSFFIGPYYTYILAALGILTSWNIYAITQLLLLMWWASALILSYFVNKKFGSFIALLTYFFFAIHPSFVGYSRMFLNPNFHVLTSIGFFYFLYQTLRKPTLKSWLLTGVFTGISISFNYVALSYLGVAFLIWVINLLRKKSTIPHGVSYLLGTVLGDLPFVMFELRHNFYNLSTILQNGLGPGGGASLFADYFIFSYLPVYIFIFASIMFLLTKLFSKPTAVVSTLLILSYLYLIYPHPDVRGIGMPVGWSVPLQQELATKICQDQQTNQTKFEIAAMVTADLRVMDLRWWVEQCAQPEGFDQYPFVDTLYLVDQGFIVNGELPGNWEVSSLEPYTIDSQEQVTDNLWFYKLSRIKSTE